MIGKTIEVIKINDSATFSKTISESDVYLFAGITGDNNPAHINEVYAQNSGFKERIVHGMLTASFISTVLGTMLPGPGTIYLSQEVKFLKPVKFGDTITAIVKVDHIDYKKNNVKFETNCFNQYDEMVLTGFAVVKPPKMMKR